MKKWAVRLMPDDTILIEDSGLRFTFTPVMVTGEGSGMNRKTCADMLVRWTGVPYADNRGRLPLFLIPGFRPEGDRKKVIEKVLGQLVRRELKRRGRRSECPRRQECSVKDCC